MLFVSIASALLLLLLRRPPSSTGSLEQLALD